MTVELVVGYCVLVFLAVVTASIVGYLATRQPTPTRLRSRLEKDLPELQDDFVVAAQKLGKPRGLTWKHCDWEQERLLARDRTTDAVVALVGVTLHLAAPDSAEEITQPASALFYYTAGRWQTLGKTIFQMRPAEVLERLGDQYEPLSS